MVAMPKSAPFSQSGSKFAAGTGMRPLTLKDTLRLYFDLVRADAIIQDEDGIEVSDLNQAQAEIRAALEELCRTDPSASIDWAGWRCDVTTAWGAVVMSIDLDSIRP
jgi:hypothetical protein